MKKLAVILLLASCATTREAGIRRSEEARLNFCVQSSRGIYLLQRQCASESAARCEAAGLEPTCGSFLSGD